MQLDDNVIDKDINAQLETLGKILEEKRMSKVFFNFFY